MISRTMTFQKYLILILISLLCTAQSQANDQEKPLFRSTLSGSYALGAQVYNSNFLFRPGYAIDYTHSYKLSKYVNAGLGASYMQLDDEHFFPIYANILALRSKNDVDKFVHCNVGYALAHSKAINAMDDYDLRGGVFFRFGLGRTFPINPKVALSTELSYVYQNARLDYQTYNTTSYTESLDYSFFQLSLGFVFNYRSYAH